MAADTPHSPTVPERRSAGLVVGGFVVQMAGTGVAAYGYTTLLLGQGPGLAQLGVLIALFGAGMQLTGIFRALRSVEEIHRIVATLPAGTGATGAQANNAP